MQTSNGTVFLNVTLLQTICYLVIPFVVDFVTRRFTNERVKAGIAAILAILTAVIQETINAGEGISLTGLAAKFLVALMTIYAAHKYVWKPIGLTGNTGAIQKAVPTGVGKVDLLKYQRARERSAA
jgi:hypothetical protein